MKVFFALAFLAVASANLVLPLSGGGEIRMRSVNELRETYLQGVRLSSPKRPSVMMPFIRVNEIVMDAPTVVEPSVEEIVETPIQKVRVVDPSVEEIIKASVDAVRVVEPSVEVVETPVDRVRVVEPSVEVVETPVDRVRIVEPSVEIVKTPVDKVRVVTPQQVEYVPETGFTNKLPKIMVPISEDDNVKVFREDAPVDSVRIVTIRN